LEAWGEEAMLECRATAVSKAARACLQKGQAVRAKAMLAGAISEKAMLARAMLAVPVKG